MNVLMGSGTFNQIVSPAVHIVTGQVQSQQVIVIRQQDNVYVKLMYKVSAAELLITVVIILNDVIIIVRI